MECKDCKEEKEVKDFYKRSDRSKHYPYCKKCFNKRNAQKLRNKKAQIVKEMGGKCQDCGLIEDPRIYDLHHLDPNTKDYKIGQITTWSIERIRKEMKKCVLLCANCHRKRHFKGV